ncbi:hypothetical protein [Streptomyces bluensis]|uniref:Uncharacterized protein n=1 Tax=Streptomyces bluensis TaxID=33897 RepID=A0ABW6UEG8_9ACTN
MAVTESVGRATEGAHAAHEGILRRQSAHESAARTCALLDVATRMLTQLLTPADGFACAGGANAVLGRLTDAVPADLPA